MAYSKIANVCELARWCRRFSEQCNPMTAKNRYKNNKPSFLALAVKYPEFRAYTTQDESGKVFLDFKNADALRALTKCLLKEDFGLTLDLPPDRLVPTLPLRLNYIHWLEDIVGREENKWGIDIGTGASCIYPILAASMNKWHFLATEADPENFFYATKNVTSNGLQGFITVKQVTSEDILVAPLQSFTQSSQFDFCMCNPPFFADHMEAQAITNTRSVQRPEAASVSTASPQECIAHGGEVGFIRHMIEESTVLRDKIRVYTSMVGKKSSLSQLKEDMRHHKVAKYSTTEFCQGKTMRWGIAWTFDETVNFPRSSFETRKEKPPLQYIVPQGAGGVEYKVHEIASYLQGILESIKIHCYQGKKAKNYTSITLTAVENTWCHQRRLRRQQKLQQSQTPQKDEVNHGNSVSVDIIGEKADTKNDYHQSSSGTQKRQQDDSDETNTSDSKRLKIGHTVEDNVTVNDKSGIITPEVTDPVPGDSPIKKGNASESDSHGDQALVDSSPSEYILKCVMRLKLAHEQVLLELEWLDGESREIMHQVLTFIKNRLAVAKH
ncbi:Methyltransferase-like protein 16 [Bulinus truncatus]|nr:Methyltransferase-like protein 16 [Bulinus truncatus]